MNMATTESGDNILKLIRWHRLFDGLFKRVAKKSGVDPSYVSRVARGDRRSDLIMIALRKEIHRLERIKPS